MYDVDNVIDYINNWTEEYNITFRKLENNKTIIYAHLGYYYYFLQYKNTSGGTKSWDDKNNLNYLVFLDQNVPSMYGQTALQIGTLSIEIVLSDKLKFLLGGFEKLDLTNVFTIENANDTNPASLTASITSMYMADASIGVNRMFIYCDEVQKSIVGNSKSSLLGSVPLKFKGQGSSELYTYTPPQVKRKLNKSIIYSFNIKVLDNEGVLVPFDSGSINIEAQII